MFAGGEYPLPRDTSVSTVDSTIQNPLFSLTGRLHMARISEGGKDLFKGQLAVPGQRSLREPTNVILTPLTHLDS